jgi:hypothetical protein
VSKTLKYSLLGFCSLLLIFNGYRAYKKTWSFADPSDFRALFVGAKMWQQNLPLYSDSIGKQVWQQTKTAENFESNTDFGDPYIAITLYPPQTYSTFFFLANMSWRQARLFWWSFCTLAFATIGFLLYTKHDTYWPAIFLLSFSGSFFGWALGQPAIFALLCIVIAHVIQAKYPIVAGIFLGFAMIKFSVVIPFALWYLYQGKWKTLFALGFTTLLLFVPVLLNYSWEIIPTWLHKTADYYAFIYNPAPQNLYTFSNSELSILLDYYFPTDITVWKTMNVVGQILGYATCIGLYFYKKLNTENLLLGLLLVSFVFTYHLAYDPILFVIPLAILPKNKTWLFLFIALMVLSLPLNALAGNLEIIKFNYVIICVLGLILFTFAALKNRLAS